MVYDAIVIGVGGMGSATAYQLAKRGASVLALGQFNIGHDFGSSHGVNRIIRLAYSEGSSYVPLLRRAYQLWRRIQQVAGEQLLYVTGGVDAGPREGSIVQGGLLSCREHQLRHELLGSERLQRRFPGFRLPRDLVAVYQPDAGFIMSERAIIAFVTAAQALGATIHGLEPVRSWRVGRGRVAVKTDLSKRRLAEPERQVLIWTHPLRPKYFQFGAFPIFNMEAPISGSMHRYYGFPAFSVPGFKFGKYHHLNESTDPDRMKRACGPKNERALRDAIVRYFPDANGPTMAMKACLFTNSPDEHFVIGTLPGCTRVIVAAGFSGHGFKFASVVGEIMADLALEGSSQRFDLSMFDLEHHRCPLS